MMPLSKRNAQFEEIVAQAFRKAGWRVRRHGLIGEVGAILVNKGGVQYAVEVKSAGEGRSDRLIPLLSQAILQAQTLAGMLDHSAAPLAIVAARRIPEIVAGQIKQFAERHAADVAIGIIDSEGFRWFSGPGLEELQAKQTGGSVRRTVQLARPADLFSDLNQWMLKILFGQRLPEPLIAVPRKPLRNASQLAVAANVSIMSASRFVNQLAREGFLDEHNEDLQIVRSEELLERWIAANRHAWREVPGRWIIKQDEAQFHARMARYAAASNVHNLQTPKGKRSGVLKPSLPRCCVGLFAAASVLGFGFVHGPAPHIYLENFGLDTLKLLGFSVENTERQADVCIRIPKNKEAVFRPAVLHNGLPVSDVLQVWIDVSSHPSRGREQANEIRRRVFKPLFGKRP